MTLLDEIKQKCSPELLASKDNEAIAAQVNIGRTKNVLVLISDIQAYLQGNGSWWTIKQSNDPSAIATIDVANARYEHIDLSLPFVQSMLNGLVAANLITQQDHININKMGIIDDFITEFDVRCSLYDTQGNFLG